MSGELSPATRIAIMTLASIGLWAAIGCAFVNVVLPLTR